MGQKVSRTVGVQSRALGEEELEEAHGAQRSEFVSAIALDDAGGFAAVVSVTTDGAAEALACSDSGKVVYFNAVSGAQLATPIDLEPRCRVASVAAVGNHFLVGGSYIGDNGEPVGVSFEFSSDDVVSHDALTHSTRHFDTPVMSVALSDAHSAVLCLNGTMEILSRRNGVRWTLDFPSHRPVNHALCLPKGGADVMLTGQDGHLHRWDLDPGTTRPTRSVALGRHVVSISAANHDNESCLVCCDSSVQLFNVTSLMAMIYLDCQLPTLCAAISRDGESIAAGLVNGAILIFSFPAGDHIGTLTLDSMVRGLAICPFNDALIAAAGTRCEVWKMPFVSGDGGWVGNVPTNVIPADLMRAYVLPYVFALPQRDGSAMRGGGDGHQAIDVGG